MSQSKSRYRELCAGKILSPIFFNDWWLDAVCGENNWDVILHETGGEITGALPYYKSKRFFVLNTIKMPLLTHYLGPLLLYPEHMKYSSKLGFEHEVIDELYSKLPPYHFLRNRFSPALTNWLPLYWKGFRQTTKYTYTIQLKDLDSIFKDFKSNMRGKIRKASEIVTIEFTDDIRAFHALHEKTFQRQQMENPVGFEWLKKLDDALQKKGRRKIAIAVDKDKKIHSAAYILWDDECAYLSMVGEDPELRSSGAGILLIWEMIKYSKDTLGLKRFDFLGSMLKNVEIVRRSMGGEQTPYFEITRSTIPFL